MEIFFNVIYVTSVADEGGEWSVPLLTIFRQLDHIEMRGVMRLCMYEIARLKECL